MTVTVISHPSIRSTSPAPPSLSFVAFVVNNIVQFSMLINLSINHHLQLSMGRIGVGLSPKLLMGVAEGMEVGGTVGGGLAQTTAVN